jgi:hypothetical protein
MIKSITLTIAVLLSFLQQARSQESVNAINETTPSKSIYFSWINHAWEGANEYQTLVNLNFFKWMHTNYGMKLDLYLMDAGNLDEGPECIGMLFGDNKYGSFDSKRFMQKFPNGLKPIADLAKSFDCSLGMWMGPDGYGSTPLEAQKRSEMLVSLCRDYGVKLFKFDACCSNLSAENQQYFVNTIKECRKFSPDLIVLNHRISLNEEAKKQTTTWLWEGQETYIDINMPGKMTAPHHRTGSLSRGLVPGLQRLTEDHGVCLSSCLDYWDDDLILQAFNRSLILAPEIYGSPWLLRDSELPKLARIYNLHHQFNDILVNGMVLPLETYGENAVSRGNGNTRIITLRNLTWNSKTINLKLDGSIGLTTKSAVEVRQYHPTEKILGVFRPGEVVKIDVLPFRTCLVAISGKFDFEPGIKGCDYEIVKNVADQPVEVNLLGFPGTTHSITLKTGDRHFTKATLDGKPANELLNGKPMKVAFGGKKLNLPYHRKLADLQATDFPKDAEELYEASCFAADNNALEVRSLFRSGPTEIAEVQKARDAFFKRDVFVEKGIWDKNLFDNDTATHFKVSKAYSQQADKVFRIDLGATTQLDSLVLREIKSEARIQKVEASADLIHWKTVNFKLKDENLTLIFTTGANLTRYYRISNSPESMAEIEGFYQGKQVNRTAWRASNLFSSFTGKAFTKAWSASFILPELAKNSYLAIAIPGKYTKESVYAAMRVNGNVYGAPDRSISYPSHTWEAPVFDDVRGDYTYYVPLTKDMINQKINVVVMGNSTDIKEIKAEVWITAYPAPYEIKKMILE